MPELGAAAVDGIRCRAGLPVVIQQAGLRKGKDSADLRAIVAQDDQGAAVRHAVEAAALFIGGDERSSAVQAGSRLTNAMGSACCGAG